jgi:hypothetical protein
MRRCKLCARGLALVHVILDRQFLFLNIYVFRNFYSTRVRAILPPTRVILGVACADRFNRGHL